MLTNQTQWWTNHSFVRMRGKLYWRRIPVLVPADIDVATCARNLRASWFVVLCWVFYSDMAVFRGSKLLILLSASKFFRQMCCGFGTVQYIFGVIPVLLVLPAADCPYLQCFGRRDCQYPEHSHLQYLKCSEVYKYSECEVTVDGMLGAL